MPDTPHQPSPGEPGTRRIGYARVSITDQDPDPQLDVLRARVCDPIYSEHASGKSADRPKLAQALKAVRAGDTLVVWRLDRLGRSLPDVIATINALAKRGIAFESVTEAIDTTTAAGKLVFNIFASLAEFERHLISERTRAGLAAGRTRGRLGGRPPALTPRQLREARLLLTDPDAPRPVYLGRARYRLRARAGRPRENAPLLAQGRAAGDRECREGRNRIDRH